MSGEKDAGAVYDALKKDSPQDGNELAASSGVAGERLEAAVETLEQRGLVKRGYETDGGADAYSFSWVQLVG